MVKKACSTFEAFLADVSRKGMPRLSANSYISIKCQTLSSLVCESQLSDTYLRNGVLHDLLVRHITLVAHQQLVHTLCSVAVDLLKPLLDIVE